MCFSSITCVALFGAMALPAAVYAAVPISDKASNITQDDTHSLIAPSLPPPPPVGDDASPLDYLKVAQAALAHHHTGEAQEALERAEARALDRAVPLFQTDKPIDDPLVAKIRQARLALGHNDISRATQLIASASDAAAHLALAQ
jgi:hypothetical protein